MFNYIFLVNQTQLGYNYDPIKNIIRKTPNLKKKNSILTPQNIEYQNQTITKQILKELEDESLMYGLPLENRVAEEEEKERESSEEILQEAMVLNKTHSQYCMSLFLMDSFEPNSVYIMAFTSKFCPNEWFLLIFFVFEYYYYYYYFTIIIVVIFNCVERDDKCDASETCRQPTSCKSKSKSKSVSKCYNIGTFFTGKWEQIINVLYLF